MRFTPAKVTMLMFVVVGGLIAAYVGKRLLAREETPVVVRTMNIPTPIADLEPGTIVTAAHLGVAPIRENQLEPDMLRSNRAIIGRVVKVPIKALNPIRAADLFGPGEFPPISVEPGSRAISITLRDAVDMVDGLIAPEQFVDVHFTPSGGASDARYRGGLTMTLFKGVKVLAINRSIRQGGIDQTGSSVTFELTPQQANIILLAREKGALTLSYTSDQKKGDGGVAVASDDRATLEEILGLSPLPEPPEPQYSELYRGSSYSVQRYRDGRRDDGSFRDRSTPRSPTDQAPADDRGAPAPPPVDSPRDRDTTAAI